MLRRRRKRGNITLERVAEEEVAERKMGLGIRLLLETKEDVVALNRLLLQIHNTLNATHYKRRIVRVLLLTTCWMIWKARNEVIFTGNRVNIEESSRKGSQLWWQWHQVTSDFNLNGVQYGKICSLVLIPLRKVIFIMLIMARKNLARRLGSSA